MTGGGEDDARPFRLDAGAHEELAEPPRGFHDQRIGLMANQGQYHEARYQLTRTATGSHDPRVFLDAMRLERLALPSSSGWWAWLAQGLMAAPELSEQLPAWVNERELAKLMAEGRVNWQALRAQRDAAGRLRLFALRLAHLLWEGRAPLVIDALDDEAFIEHCAGDARARRVAMAALYSVAWDEPEGAGKLLPRYTVPPSEPATLDLGALAAEAARRAHALDKVESARPCPSALARALRLGPVFGGEAGEALVDALRAELEREPQRYLAFCETAADRAPHLTAWLSELFTTLGDVPATAPLAIADGALDAVERALADDPLPRTVWGAGSVVTAGLLASSLWIGPWGLGLAALVPAGLPFVVRGLRATVHGRSLRGPLARTALASGLGPDRLAEAMRGRRHLASYAPFAAADPALALLCAIAGLCRGPA